MSSMHLSLVVSPVVPLTLSLLAVRVADVPVGVAGVADLLPKPWSIPHGQQEIESHGPASGTTFPFVVALMGVTP